MDLEKANDLIDRKSIWLRVYGIGRKSLNAVQRFHVDRREGVKVEN